MAHEASHGRALTAALDQWPEHRPLPGVRLATSALGLGAETGGAQARALDGVAATLRSRRAVGREVRALSSQARMSGVVITLAPLGFSALAAATDERTASFLLATPLGLFCLATGLASTAPPHFGCSDCPGSRPDRDGWDRIERVRWRRSRHGSPGIRLGWVGPGRGPAPRSSAGSTSGPLAHSQLPDPAHCSRRWTLAVVVGQVLLRIARRPAGERDARRLGRAVLAGSAALVLSPWTAPPVGAAVWALPALDERRRRRRHRDELLRHLPEVADLFVLVVGAGLTVPLAVAAVSRRAPGPLAVALAQAVEQTKLGRRLADALDDIPTQVGEEVRPLTSALVASDRYGAPCSTGSSASAPSYGLTAGDEPRKLLGAPR